MDATQRKRLATFTGAFAVVLAVAVLSLTVVSGGMHGAGGPDSLFGWAVPLVALFVIVAVTWLLLARDNHEPEVDEDLYVPCSSCGHAVMHEWRLCPYCGARLRAWNPGGGSLNRS